MSQSGGEAGQSSFTDEGSMLSSIKRGGLYPRLKGLDTKGAKGRFFNDSACL